MKSTQDLAAFRCEQGFAPNQEMDEAIFTAAMFEKQAGNIGKKKSQ